MNAVSFVTLGFCIMAAALNPCVGLIPRKPVERRFSPPQKQPWWWGVA